MTQTATLTTFIFFNVLSFSLLPSQLSAFTLKLTHRDSPLSPLYQSNLTDLQRLTKHVEISTARASYLQQMYNGNSTTQRDVSIRLPIKYDEPLFTTEIGIGTPPSKKTLIFDTGSGLTWTQCTPCRTCFKQNDPLFDPKKSSTYITMPKKHPLARGFSCSIFGRTCSYKMGYYSGQSSTGVAAVETFTFLSNAGPPARVSNLVFGCGTRSVGEFPPVISGIIGFNRESYSFTRQLRSFINDRFSYCLTYSGQHAGSSSVKFGDEAVVHGRDARKTPFLNRGRGSVLYGLNLLDLSINGQKLGVGKAFGKGCFIDSGASVSLLNMRAFTAVTGFLDKYLFRFGIKRYQGHMAPRKMHCYTLPENFRSFPGMDFNFQGADYYIPFQNVFLFIQGDEGKVFCLAMVESKDMTILGAYQQRNTRILYDLKAGMLSFAPEIC